MRRLEIRRMTQCWKRRAIELTGYSRPTMNTLRSLISVAVLATLPLIAAAQLPAPLTEAARKAVVTNPEVQARWNAFRASEAERDVARAGYFPRVDLLAGVGHENRRRPGEGTDNYDRHGAELALN